MRRVVASIRSLLVDVIGLEGMLVLPGFVGLVLIGWSLDWRIGATILCSGLLVAGLAAARPVPKE